MDREWVLMKRKEIEVLILNYKEKSNDKDYGKLKKIYENLSKKATRLEKHIDAKKTERAKIEEEIQNLLERKGSDKTSLSGTNMDVLEMKKWLNDSWIFLDTKELENIQWLKSAAVEGLKVRNKTIEESIKNKTNNQSL